MVKMIFIIIGAILLIWFLIPVFTYRILNIGNVTGMIVGLVLLLYGIFFRPVNRFLASFWQYGIGKVIEIIIGVCILAILVLAVMTTVCMVRGMRQTAASEKTIIVLGCKVIGEAPSLMLSERLQTALSYLNEHPEAHAIVSGGQGEDEIVPEAEVMYSWLTENGISADRLLKEDRSTDTHENLQYCYEILTGADISSGSEIVSKTEEVSGAEDLPDTEHSSDWSTDVVIVTNEFHEYRALKIARAAGFRAEPLPAATAWWLFPTYYVREMYGILEDWFLN